MDKLLQDLRYALRTLCKNKGSTLVVVLTLALGIASNGSIFTMVEAMMFRLLPLPEPESIAFIWFTNPELGRVRAPFSYPDYVDFRREILAFEDLAALTATQHDLAGLDEPARVAGYRVSANFFPSMNLVPILGRVFLIAEDSPGAAPVAILSQGCWERRFGADPAVIGREILLDGERSTVVAVMTPALELGIFRDVEIWTPLALDENRAPRDRRDLMVLGRFKLGTGIRDARAQAETLAKRLEQNHPRTNSGWTASVIPAFQSMVGGQANVVLFLLTMTGGFVLLIACFNVANLLLAQSVLRRKEITVRTALGAARQRVVRQLLTESALLSLLAGGFGLLLTFVTLEMLVRISRGRFSFLDLSIDGNAILFTIGVALVTPMVFGLLPALRTSRADLNQELKQGGGRSVVCRSRLRRVLVAAQVSLALVLLVVAGLTVRTMNALQDIELGFEPDHLLTFRVDRPPSKSSEETWVQSFFQQVLQNVQALPGVEGAGLASTRPIVGGEPDRSFTIEGSSVPNPAELPRVATVTVSPEFFNTLRVPLVQGRLLTSYDTAVSPSVAVISKATADRFWPDKDPIGRRVRLGPVGSERAWIEIVGVVGDLRNPDADQMPEPHIYLPYAQNPLSAMAVIVRTEAEPLALLPSLRQAIREVDPDQPIHDTRTMREILFDDLVGFYSLTWLLGYFGTIALALAFTGTYATVSYFVSERSRDIGIRMALGAQISNVLANVILRGLTPVLIGLATGVLAAFAVAGIMANMLYGITTTDPMTFLGVPFLLVTLALVAIFVPAIRAARVDPIITLRHE